MLKYKNRSSPRYQHLRVSYYTFKINKIIIKISLHRNENGEIPRQNKRKSFLQHKSCFCNSTYFCNVILIIYFIFYFQFSFNFVYFAYLFSLFVTVFYILTTFFNRIVGAYLTTSANCQTHFKLLHIPFLLNCELSLLMDTFLQWLMTDCYISHLLCNILILC